MATEVTKEEWERRSWSKLPQGGGLEVEGMRMKNGWKNSGLPWTYEIDRDRMALPARETNELQPGNDAD